MGKPIDPQQLARLRTALHRLPARQRTIFLALTDETTSYATLAKRHGIDEAETEREFVSALVALAAAAAG